MTEDGRKRDEIKEKTAMVFQNFGLLDHRTVLDNVVFGLELQGVDKKERQEKFMEKLKLIGLEEEHNSMISELSSGMQQRVGYVSWTEGIAMDWMQMHNGLIYSWLKKSK